MKKLIFTKTDFLNDFLNHYVENRSYLHGISNLFKCGQKELTPCNIMEMSK